MRRNTVVAGLVALLGVAALGHDAAAEEPAATGWWWAGRPSATSPSVFTPVPTPPEKGLYVAGSAAGPWGISALRFEVEPGATATTLTLRVDEASGTPVVVACRSIEAWKATENGAWDERPGPDCGLASAPGRLNADGTEVAFDLETLQDGRIVDVVLVPGVDTTTGRTAAFAVAFKPPGDALAVTSPPRPTNDFTPTSAPDPTPPADEPGQAFASPVIPFTPSQPLPDPMPAAGDATVAPTRQARLTSSFPADDGFDYPAVLALPLVLLVAGGYLAWVLTQPVAARARPR